MHVRHQSAGQPGAVTRQCMTAWCHLLAYLSEKGCAEPQPPTLQLTGWWAPTHPGQTPWKPVAVVPSHAKNTHNCLRISCPPQCVPPLPGTSATPLPVVTQTRTPAFAVQGARSTMYSHGWRCTHVSNARSSWPLCYLAHLPRTHAQALWRWPRPPPRTTCMPSALSRHRTLSSTYTFGQGRTDLCMYRSFSHARPGHHWRCPSCSHRGQWPCYRHI